jgi:hypothetical protein
MNTPPSDDYFSEKLPVFRRTRFDELTFGDQGLQRTLTESFLRQSEHAGEEIRASSEAGPTQFGEMVHKLRSTAHFVAGERLAWMLKELEARRAAREPRARRAAAEAILRELDELRRVLAAR